MFNFKKIKELEKENQLLREKLMQFEIIQNLLLDNRNLLAELKNKIEPKDRKVINYSFDAKVFAQSLQAFNKKRSCGGRGCGIYYMIPCTEIDSVANKIIPKEAAEIKQ